MLCTDNKQVVQCDFEEGTVLLHVQTIDMWNQFFLLSVSHLLLRLLGTVCTVGANVQMMTNHRLRRKWGNIDAELLVLGLYDGDSWPVCCLEYICGLNSMVSHSGSIMIGWVQRDKLLLKSGRDEADAWLVSGSVSEIHADMDGQAVSSTEGGLQRVREVFRVWVVMMEWLWSLTGLGGAVKAPLRLTLGGLLFILGTLAPRTRWVCSWSNSRSSRRWVKASFCWIAIRRREFNVFFSSSAAASCLCISSSWVTYSSHLQKEGETVRFFFRHFTLYNTCFDILAASYFQISPRGKHSPERREGGSIFLQRLQLIPQLHHGLCYHRLFILILALQISQRNFCCLHSTTFILNTWVSMKITCYGVFMYCITSKDKLTLPAYWPWAPVWVWLSALSWYWAATWAWVSPPCTIPCPCQA